MHSWGYLNCCPHMSYSGPPTGGDNWGTLPWAPCCWGPHSSVLEAPFLGPHIHSVTNYSPASSYMHRFSIYKKIVESKTDANLIHNVDSWILNYHDVIMLCVISFYFGHNYRRLYRTVAYN